MTVASTTRFNLGTTSPTGFGSYRVAPPGTATLAGTLELLLGPNFDYVTGDEFVLIDAPGGRAGTFVANTIINERQGAVLDVVYTPTSVRLRVLRGGCDDIDFNNDGLFPDDTDLLDLLAVLAGGACSTGSCGSIDFNNDGLFPDDEDLVAFLRVLAGGSCS